MSQYHAFARFVEKECRDRAILLKPDLNGIRRMTHNFSVRILIATVGELLADARTGKNGRHALVGLLRQSVFGRLAGYKGVNDAERLRHDPATRWIVGGKAALNAAASPSQMAATLKTARPVGWDGSRGRDPNL